MIITPILLSRERKNYRSVDLGKVMQLGSDRTRFKPRHPYFLSPRKLNCIKSVMPLFALTTVFFFHFN